MATPTTPRRPLADLDAPTEQVAAGLPLVELRHLLDTAGASFDRLAAEHPETCSCADDYPGWTPGRTA
ncbi:hypothetical protein [Streptomyces sparsogenes]|uniref:Uncharacterized protein n=1 Tax=Streptomyces sparsogenes DSM 40356 TaxID=1331668 RepID=A0A1R1S810_9ACTN|nr:hypothetical protein [Streptomyces sparsogenes]OMI34471.1 hypothetical protein SPAR_36846 [Streptomyces sparsogenes DSM 40356]